MENNKDAPKLPKISNILITGFTMIESEKKWNQVLNPNVDVNLLNNV
jgi:hypothetical protein